MASPKPHPVPQSRKEPQVPTGRGAPTTKCAREHLFEYGRERPGTVALWCLGIGFVLGWKLKLW
ncbi:MAG: hypothetical protein ACYC6N_20795 [Pirellulaceae bacterium]